MTDFKRRYFVADNPQLRDEALEKAKEHRRACMAVAERHGAQGFELTRDGRIVALAFEDVDKKRPDMIDRGRRMLDDKRVAVWRPRINRKVGRALLEEFAKVGAFSGNDYLLAYYGLKDWMLYHAGAMHFAVAAIKKDMIAISAPEDSENPLTVHAELKEMKKSEWIALTEE